MKIKLSILALLFSFSSQCQFWDDGIKYISTTTKLMTSSGSGDFASGDISADGTKLILSNSNEVSYYTMTAWDFSNPTYGGGLSVTSKDFITTIKYKDSGNKLYMLAEDSIIMREDMSTAYDVSTASYVQETIWDDSTLCFDISSDGENIMSAYNLNIEGTVCILEWGNMATPWDLLSFDDLLFTALNNPPKSIIYENYRMYSLSIADNELVQRSYTVEWAINAGTKRRQIWPVDDNYFAVFFDENKRFIYMLRNTAREEEVSIDKYLF